MVDKVQEIKSSVTKRHGDKAAEQLDELKLERIGSSKTAGEFSKPQTKEGILRFQKEVLSPLNAALFNNGKSLESKDTQTIRAIGTHQKGNEKFVVFADYENGKEHDVFLLGEDKKFRRVLVDPKSKSDSQRFVETGEAIDSLPGLTLESYPEKEEPASVERKTFADLPKQIKVNASGDRNWTINNELKNDTIHPNSIEFRQNLANGGTSVRLFTPDPKVQGRWFCNEWQKNTKDEVFKKSTEKPYWIQANETSITMTAVEGNTPLTSETYFADGGITRTLKADPLSAVWTTQHFQHNRTDGFNAPTEIAFSWDKDGTPHARYRLSHSFQIGNRKKELYTRTDRDDPSLYVWNGKNIEKLDSLFREFATPI